MVQSHQNDSRRASGTGCPCTTDAKHVSYAEHGLIFGKFDGDELHIESNADIELE